mmetsp:Transcript_40349/g.83987  ORF Transcript_40349/g.83987 Transcript_40349/m.83987 type:complete len:324 (-) Transcript_40349:385-1356(-)
MIPPPPYKTLYSVPHCASMSSHNHVVSCLLHVLGQQHHIVGYQISDHIAILLENGQMQWCATIFVPGFHHIGPLLFDQILDNRHMAVPHRIMEGCLTLLILRLLLHILFIQLDHILHHLQVAPFTGGMQRCQTLLVGRLEHLGSSGLFHQTLDHFQPTPFTGKMQGGLALLVLGFHMGSMVNQTRYHLEMISPTGHMQGCGAIFVFSFHQIGSSGDGDQILHHLQMTLVTGLVEGGVTLLVACVDKSSFLIDQELYHGQVPFLTGVMQGCITQHLVGQVDIYFVIVTRIRQQQQLLDLFQITRLGSFMKGGHCDIYIYIFYII